MFVALKSTLVMLFEVADFVEMWPLLTVSLARCMIMLSSGSLHFHTFSFFAPSVFLRSFSFCADRISLGWLKVMLCVVSVGQYRVFSVRDSHVVYGTVKQPEKCLWPVEMLSHVDDVVCGYRTMMKTCQFWTDTRRWESFHCLPCCLLNAKHR